jgi:hypothetical protein
MFTAGSSNELGAFEAASPKLTGTVTAVVFGGTMTLISVVTYWVICSTFENLI